MKWELTEPKFGDLVRVKTGSIYHYGIYASDLEVIQFGLPPVSRQGIDNSLVAVCATSIEDFLVGGFLEVGVREKKDKKRHSPKKTVALARARLGEKGYHILNNNCEHFANECYFGEKRSNQTDGVRELFRNMPVVDVYIAPIPREFEFSLVSVKARQKEINAVKNPSVKAEKYFAWKLLEVALEKSFGKKLIELKPKKCATGKWVLKELECSISHGDGLVAVAVSKKAVGVDIEKIEKPKVDISKEILSETEYAEYLSLEEDKKTEFVINAWSKKESLFKLENKKSLSREGFRNLNAPVFQKMIYFNNTAYSLSVATCNIEKVKVFENINLV